MGPPELLIILVIAVLLYGKRLPEVARSLGKTMMEFKRGISGLQEELQSSLREETSSSSSAGSSAGPSAAVEEDEEPTAPKFEPPPSEPKPGAELSKDSAKV